MAPLHFLVEPRTLHDLEGRRIFVADIHGEVIGFVLCSPIPARKGWLKDASYDEVPGVYRLGERRRDARNFFAVPARLGQKVKGSEPQDIGWRFGALGAGTPVRRASVPFSTSNSVQVVYDAASGTWRLSQAGRAIPVAPANIIIQKVAIHRSRFSDVHGMNTPFTVSTGSGNVAVLRDGRRIVGTWKRTGYGATRLLDAAGHDILLKPGATWVMLEPSLQRASYS